MLQRRQPAAGLGRAGQGERERGRLLGPLDPVRGRHLTLQPPLPGLRLLRHLLGVALELVAARAAGGRFGGARLAAGAGDVGLQPLAVALLGAVLLLAPLEQPLLLGPERRVAALVDGQGTCHRIQLEDARDRLIEEAAVVGHDQHGTREGRQIPLQPADAVQVEVVGRLVQQQDGGTRQQHPGQHHAGRLPARQLAEARAVGQAGDADVAAHLVDRVAEAPSVQRLVAVLERAVGGHRGLVARRHRRFQRPHLAVGGVDLAGRPAQVLPQRQIRIGRLLLEVGDAVGVAHADAAGVRPAPARQQAQQRRLADAVGADQTYPVAVSEDEGDIVEERFGVVRRP